MDSINVEFDFGDYFPRKDDEKLIKRDENKMSREKYNDEYKKEMRKKTREKEKKNRQIQQEVISKMTEEERDKYYDDKKAKNIKMDENLKKGLESNYHIVFDLEYERLMNTANLKSLTSQLAYCYSLNKKSDNPFAYHFCSYKGELKEYLEKMGCGNWLVYTYEESFYDIDKITNMNMVYLSPDSDNILTSVDKDTVYIVGGLVDKPVSSNQSLYRANLYNIPHARLPLDNYLKDNLFVLNVNTVIELLSSYITKSTWDDGIATILPKRKLN